MFIRVLFLLIGGLYIKLQSVYIFGGDSAEYATAASTYSIPHAPGYPFYTLLGNLLVKIIPLETNVWRLSLLSSIPTVLTSFFIYLILRKLTKNQYLSFISSIFYLFLFPVWLYAEVPEVFALNSLFIAVITYLVLRYNESKKNIIKYLIFLFIGLSAAHHYTFILFVPGWYVLLKKELRNDFLLKNLKYGIFFILIGISFYLYPPIASMFNPPIDWENAKSLDGFLRMITRSSYGGLSAYAESRPNIGNQIFDSLSIFIFVFKDFKILGTIFIAGGFYYIFKKKVSIRHFLLANLLITIVFLFYSNFQLTNLFVLGIFERFLTFVYLNLIFYFAFGIIFFREIILNIQKKYIQNSHLKNFISLAFYITLGLFTFIVFINNYPTISSVKSTKSFELYADDVLNTVPTGSILFMSGDTGFFTTQYNYSVQKKRPDIKLIFITLLNRDYYRQKVIKEYPEIIMPAYNNQNISNQDDLKFFTRFLELNSKKYPIFFQIPINIGFWQPYGLVWKYYSTAKDAQMDADNLIRSNDQTWANYHLPQISSNQRNLLLLYNLKDLYIRSLTSYINVLTFLDKTDKSAGYISRYENFLGKDTLEPLLTKIYLQKKDCPNLKQNIQPLLNKPKGLLSFDEVTNILKYFGICDDNNTKVYEYLNHYRYLKTGSPSVIN